MKQQYAKWLATVSAVAAGLVMANSTQGQDVTGTPYLSNITSGSLTAVYPSWNDANTTITSTSTGLEVANVGSSEGGAFYYALTAGQVTTLSANDTFANITLTVNGGNQAGFVWNGLTVILNDTDGNSQTFNTYSGDGNPGNPAGVTWTGNTLTEALTLNATMLGDIQAGNDSITGITLGFYPATLSTPGGEYDITYNSIDLSSTAVPEPTSISLAGLGALGLWMLRRRQ